MKALMKVLFISLFIGTIGCRFNDFEMADIVKNNEADWVEETAVIDTTCESVTITEVTEAMTETQEITTMMPSAVAETVEITTAAAVTTASATTTVVTEKVELPALLVDESVDDPYTYYEMEVDIEELKNTYTDNLNVDILGQSYDNRNLYLLTLGNPDAPKSVLFTASIHGAEYITSQLVMAQAEYYLSNMTEKYNGKTIKEILDNVCIYIMPMVNPDSVCISQYGFSIINDDNLRTKLFKLDYTDTWSSNARGVDINRNFPTDGFGKENADNQGNSKPSFKYYEGEYAGSEIETQVIMEFVKAHPTLMAFISYHSKGEVIYWNKGQTGTAYRNTKKMAELIADITDYRSVEYLQVKSGIDYEWAILEAGLAGCTIEIGDIESWFPVRQTQWKDIWKRNKYVMIAVADLFEELKR